MTLRRQSAKRRKLDKSVADARRYLREEASGCEACGHSPWNPWADKPMQCSVLTVHEIRRGAGNRHRFLDKRFGTLVLCQWCNTQEFDYASKWPEARQLCLLMAVRKEDYNLKKYNHLVNPFAPNRITQAEVDFYADGIQELVNSGR